MKAVFKRECAGFFHTGLGFLFLFIFAVLSGAIFYLNNLLPRSSDMSGFFALVSYLWMLLSPILVMRLLPSDIKNSTQPLLMTSPASVAAIVSAKYLAAFVMLTVSLLASLVFPLVIALFGRAYLPEICVGFIGLLLYGAAYLAFDMLASVFARNAASAFALALGANLLLRLSGVIASAVKLRLLPAVLSFFDLEKRYLPFINGQLSFASIIYYVLMTAACLICTIQAMNIRRWSHA